MRKIDTLVIAALLRQYGPSSILVEMASSCGRIGREYVGKGEDKQAEHWRLASKAIENTSILRDVVLCSVDGRKE